MRLARVMTGLSLVLISATVASCGSSRGSGAASPTTIAVNPTADRTTARGINLTSSDLPGWTQTPNSSTSADQVMGSRLAACAGSPSPSKIDVVDVSSPYFDQGQAEVSSDVTMVRTHADGLADLKGFTSPKLGACVRQIFVPYLKKEIPASDSISNLQSNSFNLPDAPRDSFALRIGVTVSDPQQGSVSIVSDVVGFLSGRAEVELSASQTQGGNPSQALEQQLLSVLVARTQHRGVASA